jgi:hypothetical protein
VEPVGDGANGGGEEEGGAYAHEDGEGEDELVVFYVDDQLLYPSNLNLSSRTIEKLGNKKRRREDLPVQTLSVKIPISVKTLPITNNIRGPLASNIGPICTPQKYDKKT